MGNLFHYKLQFMHKTINDCFEIWWHNQKCHVSMVTVLAFFERYNVVVPHCFWQVLNYHELFLHRVNRITTKQFNSLFIHTGGTKTHLAIGLFKYLLSWDSIVSVKVCFYTICTKVLPCLPCFIYKVRTSNKDFLRTS